MNDQPLTSRQQLAAAPVWNQSVRWRLLTRGAAILAMGLLAALLVYWQVGRLITAVDTLETVSNQVAVATDVRHSSTALLADVSRVLPLEDSELFVGEVGDSLSQLQASQARLEGLIDTVDNPNTLTALQAVDQRVQNIINVSDTMVRQAANAQWPSVRVRVGVLNRDQQQVVNEVNALVDQVRALESQALARVAASRRAAVLYPALIGLAALALMAVSLSQIMRTIAGPVERLTEGAGRLAAGAFDERVPVESQDEMGQLARAFNQMAEQLEVTYKGLEERVQDRTRDLALASEVGQRLSQVRELDVLAREAVERIRERFDLYYVQLYLADEMEQRLSLYAGTGEIGAELAERGHRLPVDATSINGMAAQTREAVIIADTTESDLFRPNPLLPETSSEMAVPLVAGDNLVGVLDLQGLESGTLSADTLPAFEVLAGQLAIAIENARLFQEVDQAREELAERRREVIRTGWEGFLNAVDRDERLEAHYLNDELVDPDQPLVGENRLTTSITLNNEPIGAIELEAAPDLHWSGAQIEIVNSVAQQVAQQVENLRLLAEAQRYREESEAAMRRVTREGWEVFAQAQDASALTYRYQGDKLTASGDGDAQLETVGEPLSIRGQRIGELTVAGPADRERAATLVTAVAERLGAHIENLRLSQQTEVALVEARRRGEELETLNRIVTEIGATLDLQESLQLVVRELVATTRAHQARVALLDASETSLTIVAEELDPEQTTASALGIEIPIAGNVVTQQVLETQMPVLITAPQHDPRLASMHDLFREQGIEMMLLLPIMAGNRAIGTVGVDILEAGVAFTEAEERLTAAIVLQAATSIQNSRLFEQVQDALETARRRSEELVILNRVTTEISATLDLQESLQLIVRELVTNTSGDQARLWLFDKERMMLVMAAEELSPAENSQSLQGVEMPIERNPLTQIVLEQREPLLITDTASDPRLEGIRHIFLDVGIRSLILLPVLAGNEVIGNVGVDIMTEGKSFTEGDERLAEAIVFQAATAIQNSHLFDQVQASLALTERLYAAGEQINTAGADVQEAVAALAEAAPVPAINRILLFDLEIDAEDELAAAEVVATWYSGEGPPPSPRGTRYEQAALRALTLLQAERPVIFDDTATDEHLDPATRQAFQQLEVPSAAVIPLWAGGRQIGSLLLETAEPHQFAEVEMDPYIALAGQLAVAIDRQRLVEVAQRRAEREHLINVIGQQIQDAPTIERAMQIAVGELGRAVRARRAVVELDIAREGSGNGSSRPAPGEQPAPEISTVVDSPGREME